MVKIEKYVIETLMVTGSEIIAVTLWLGLSGRVRAFVELAGMENFSGLSL